MDTLISAREALKLSLENSTHDITEALKKIISSINKAVEEGEFSCTVTFDNEIINRHVLKYLKQQGYDVSYGEQIFINSPIPNYKEIKISW